MNNNRTFPPQILTEDIVGSINDCTICRLPALVRDGAVLEFLFPRAVVCGPCRAAVKAAIP